MKAIAAYQAGRPDQAEKLFRDIVRQRPNDVDALRMIGFLCNQAGRHADAVEHFDRVLRLSPKQPQIHYLRGICLLALKRFQEALDSFNGALAIDGPQADTYVNRGVALQRLERLSQAIESYDRAIALDPFYVLAHTNKAATLEDQGKLAEALASYDNSLKIQATSDAWWGRGTVLQLLRRYDEALFALKQAHALEPSRPYLQGAILSLKMQLGDWDDFAQDCELVLKGVDKGLRVAMPGSILYLPSTLGQQRRAAEIYTRDKFPAPPAPPPAPDPRAHAMEGKVGSEEGREGVARPAGKPKITIGYFSCDFHNHPLSQLTAGMFENHDRDHFTVFGFPFGARHDDEYARRVARAMDRFIDISSTSDQDAASLARSLGVDIAVDLTGLTFSGRLGIFAHRAAPVQATYMGYPATTGCSFFDYVIADEVVIPTEEARFFSEQPVRLPGSYYVHDSKRPPVDEPRSRSAYGLPEQAFVYCCFNNCSKLTPDVFAIWMSLLRRVPDSVLWLLADNASFVRNLRKRAQASGVDPERLIFAERAELREYLSRQRHADLALDTLHYNGHTTTSDTLWAGVPVVTRKGTTFAGRVAASLLLAIGLPDLITHTAEEYEELAFRLATDRELLDSVKQRLVRNRATSSLFDTVDFTRKLEAAYRTMVGESGRQPMA
jgi:predicted O-linked N-acetylglucosamine transferase (SPINDLY family)